MKIIGCTIHRYPFIHLIIFNLARSKTGQLIWKRVSGNTVQLFSTKEAIEEHVNRMGWVVLKRRKRVRSFYWYKEGDL